MAPPPFSMYSPKTPDGDGGPDVAPVFGAGPGDDPGYFASLRGRTELGRLRLMMLVLVAAPVLILAISPMIVQFDGILFFPLTPFDSNGNVNESVLTEHIASGVEHGAGGVFAACGTGEIHALSAAEHATVVRRAVEVSAGRTPVVAGAGGSVGTAVEQTALAREVGADGVLLLPPWKISGCGRCGVLTGLGLRVKSWMR